jgi:hypothetical protein
VVLAIGAHRKIYAIAASRCRSQCAAHHDRHILRNRTNIYACQKRWRRHDRAIAQGGKPLD